MKKILLLIAICLILCGCSNDKKTYQKENTDNINSEKNKTYLCLKYQEELSQYLSYELYNGYFFEAIGTDVIWVKEGNVHIYNTEEEAKYALNNETCIKGECYVEDNYYYDLKKDELDAELDVSFDIMENYKANFGYICEIQENKDTNE